MITTNDKNSDPEARAKRLKRLRVLADLSRPELCKLMGINGNTIAGWEVGRYGGLPIKGAKKVLSAVSGYGVQASIEWLMYGIGNGPSLFPDFKQASKEKEACVTESIRLDSEEKKIIEDLLLVRTQYKHVADCIIQDDGMLPIYLPGDYVAGIKRFKIDIESTVGVSCIVQLENGGILVRKVQKGLEQNHYSLFCINHDTTVKLPVIQDVQLVSSAPVIWLRRKNAQSNMNAIPIT